jgi:hypothetical protein
MSNYVLSFRSQSERAASAEEEAAWGQWFQELGGTVVDFGNRVGRTTTLGSGPASGTVLSGYVVIAADDFEAAVALAKGCPGLLHDGGVEIGEIVAM